MRIKITMTDYPNREHRNAVGAAHRRALAACTQLVLDAQVLARRLQSDSYEPDASDARKFHEQATALSENLAMLDALSEVREWHAADQATAVPMVPVADVASGKFTKFNALAAEYDTSEPRERTAIVTGTQDLRAVRAYLPSNYQAVADSDTGLITISGRDNAGWTLDGYVIPRLASGLITAKEQS
jgi:hypothetical protein